MSVVLLFEATAKSDSIEAFIQFTGEIVGDTRAFDGCESIEMLQGADDPTAFVMVERWASKQHHDAYVSWRAERGDLKRLFSLLTDRQLGSFIQVDI